jgi:response regulator RpfG family c-di-GMP phosphodiesterase
MPEGIKPLSQNINNSYDTTETIESEIISEGNEKIEQELLPEQPSSERNLFSNSQKYEEPSPVTDEIYTDVSKTDLFDDDNEVPQKPAIKNSDLDLSNIDLDSIDDQVLGLNVSTKELQPIPTAPKKTAPWVVLIVDDEREIHSMTKMVIGSITYKDRPLELISAYSAKEARQVLESRNDIAIVLLDVVMETDDAGLRLAREIRDDLKNIYTRIILRTGQPGAAPEKRIILDYDINDYKAKTELTSQKFFTVIISSLRSYESVINVEENRKGLENIVSASIALLQKRTIASYSNEIIEQFKKIVKTAHDGIIFEKRRGKIHVIAASERWHEFIGETLPSKAEDIEGSDALFKGLTKNMMDIVIQTFNTKQNIFGDSFVSLSLNDNNNATDTAAYISLANQMDKTLFNLVNVFCSNLSTGYENIRLLDKNALLYNKLQRANSATVLALAKFAEFKDNDTGSHVIRVKKLTELITKQLHKDSAYSDQISELFLHQVGMAAILHDVGKIGTPNEILQKKGRLTPEERVIMEKHAQDGGKILSMSAELAGGVTYLSLGAEIAWGHHEWWNGEGYPKRLKGVEIPLSARIVAVVDVFDALVSIRPYKDAWPIEKAVKLIKDNSGKQFDPVIVDAFLRTLKEQSKAQRNEVGKSTQELYDEMKEQVENSSSFSPEEFNQFMESEAVDPKDKDFIN